MAKDAAAAWGSVLDEYLPRVRSIAKRISLTLPRSVEFDDLCQEGALGLLDSWERFDPHRGVPFGAYAQLRIRGAILDSVRRAQPEFKRENDRGHGRSGTLVRVQSRPSTDRGAFPEQTRSAERARPLRVPFSEVAAAESRRECRAEGNPSSGSCPSASLLAKEESERLWGLVKRLPQPHRSIIELHYRSELNLKEIASELDIAASRVSRLHARALNRLRYLSRHHPGRSRKTRHA